MVIVKYLDLPCRVKGICTENEDDSYTIILNSKLNYEQNVESYKHELSHISNNDFSKECVDKIECDSRKLGG